MKTIKIKIFEDEEITIIFAPDQPAALTSSLKRIDHIMEDDDVAYNTGLDVLEGLILAHAVNGVDVSSEAYLDGFRVAYETLANNLS